MVAAGSAHSLAIKGGKLYSWGNPSNGRLGNGTTSPDVTSPAQIGSNTDWLTVGFGSEAFHSMSTKG